MIAYHRYLELVTKLKYYVLKNKLPVFDFNTITKKSNPLCMCQPLCYVVLCFVILM